MDDQATITVGICDEVGPLEKGRDRILAGHLAPQFRRQETCDGFGREKNILARLLGDRFQRIGQRLRRQRETRTLRPRCARYQNKDTDATEKICADLS